MSIESLEEGKKLLLEEWMKMFKADEWRLFSLDFFVLGILKRSVLLISWFVTLIKAKNFLSAVSLIRLHLDSLLQLYWARVVKNPHEYSLHKIKWLETRDYKDKEWKKMTDSYLKNIFFSDKNNKEFYGILDVYSETSWFIHFSDKLIFMAMNNIEWDFFQSSIWSEMDVWDDANEDAIRTMVIITWWLLKYVNSRVITKNLKNSTIK